MIFVLIFSCLLTPYEIAFGTNSQGDDAETGFEHVMDKIFDVLFFFDIMLTFRAAIVTENFQIIDDKKIIAKIYLEGWFTTDVLSCLPYGAMGKALLNSD